MKELRDGSAIAYSGTNNFTMETGTAYVGINEISFSSYNSASTQFTPVYGDGNSGWTEGAARNTIDYAHYDDGDGTLGDVGVGRYGCHWVYKHIGDEHVYVVYGVDSYKLAEAQAAPEPTKPTHLTDFGCLIGCIIAPQAGGSFTTIQMVTEQFFTGTAASDHANLTSLDYASAGHTGFAASGANSTITSLSGLTTPLSASQGGTGVANNDAETITIGGAGTYGVTLTLTNTTDVTLPTTGTLVNTAVATLSSLTSVGTITTGGLGTSATLGSVTVNIASSAENDIYYAGASNVLTRLAAEAGGTNKFLRSVSGGAPSWQTLGSGDIPDISATYAVVAQTFYIGTTQVAINRASDGLTLAGITLTAPLLGTPTSGTLTNCDGTASSLVAGAVTNATFTTALTVNTGTLTLTAHADNDSVLTIGKGAVSVSGSNTGDQTNISGNAATVTVDATTSDTTCFVAIFESASGSLEPQTDATLTYNADTGVLTSTFAGALTGNVTGDVSGSSGSCTGESATVATITGLAPDTATTQATQGNITSIANLATVGTITSGTLSTGAVLADVTMTLGSDADNDIYYRSSSKLARLAVNATATNKFLMTVSSGAPAWTELSSDDLSDVASIAMLDEEETVTGLWIFDRYIEIDYADNTRAPNIVFHRKRSGDPTYNVSENDYLGEVNFMGHYTSGYDLGAEIRGVVDGTPGVDDMPGRLEFLTTPDGDNESDLRMAIDNAGNIKMGDGAWTNYVNVTAGGVLSCEGTASITGYATSGANTSISSILNTGLYIGRDADNTINFATDNVIIFQTNGAEAARFGSTGELDMGNNTVGFTQQTVTYAAETTTVDWKLGNKAIMTFGAGNITTFAFTNPTKPCNLLLKLVQDGTGSRLVTAWDADIKWVGGTKPTLSTGANAVDICSFYWDGTNYHGIASLAFAVPA